MELDPMRHVEDYIRDRLQALIKEPVNWDDPEISFSFLALLIELREVSAGRAVPDFSAAKRRNNIALGFCAIAGEFLALERERQADAREVFPLIRLFEGLMHPEKPEARKHNGKTSLMLIRDATQVSYRVFTSVYFGSHLVFRYGGDVFQRSSEKNVALEFWAEILVLPLMFSRWCVYLFQLWEENKVLEPWAGCSVSDMPVFMTEEDTGKFYFNCPDPVTLGLQGFLPAQEAKLFFPDRLRDFLSPMTWTILPDSDCIAFHFVTKGTEKLGTNRRFDIKTGSFIRQGDGDVITFVFPVADIASIEEWVLAQLPRFVSLCVSAWADGVMLSLACPKEKSS